jgi:hypothetical protein
MRREIKWRLLNASDADIKKRGNVNPKSARSVVRKRHLRRNRDDSVRMRQRVKWLHLQGEQVYLTTMGGK